MCVCQAHNNYICMYTCRFTYIYIYYYIVWEGVARSLPQATSPLLTMYLPLFVLHLSGARHGNARRIIPS